MQNSPLTGSQYHFTRPEPAAVPTVKVNGLHSCNTGGIKNICTGFGSGVGADVGALLGSAVVGVTVGEDVGSIVGVEVGGVGPDVGAEVGAAVAHALVFAEQISASWQVDHPH